jgi:hypothetical protein
MEPNELVTVYTVTDPNVGEVIATALRRQGIQCHLSGESQGGFSGLGMMEIELMVRAADADRAREIIEAHEPT